MTMLEAEIIKASVMIVRAARRLGYLGKDLKPTGKPLEMSAKRSGGASGFAAQYVRGFQSGLVTNIADIMDEVEFLETRDNWAVEKILETLRK